ncbi:hypothetical protein BHE74_00058142 [Ensete ventricosum]|nr:hypothetical protein BHE74_00058142 [Ensete ventricosum]
MAGYSSPFLNDELSKRTVIFGLHMWVIIGIGVGAAFVLLLFLISLWLASRRSTAPAAIPNMSKEIQEIHVDPSRLPDAKLLGQPLQKPPPPETDPPRASVERQALLVPAEEEGPVAQQRIHVEIRKDHRITYPERPAVVVGGSSHASGESRSVEQASIAAPEVSHLGWGHWYTLRELEVSTNMFADENVIGEGGYGIVYHGTLEDNTQVNLVEWIKTMVTNRNSEGVLDPKLPEKPSSRALKKALLVALRCVDPDAQKRPKMGHVIHMLEVDDFPYRDVRTSTVIFFFQDRRVGRTYRDGPQEKARLLEKPAMESGDSSGYESNSTANRTTRWRKQEN